MPCFMAHLYSIRILLTDSRVLISKDTMWNRVDRLGTRMPKQLHTVYIQYVPRDIIHEPWRLKMPTMHG
jgi:hypothetical protein